MSTNRVLYYITGDYYGKGIVRKQELYRSAMTLGIRQRHISIISDGQLPDHPQVSWQPQDINQHVSRVAERHGIETVSGVLQSHSLRVKGKAMIRPSQLIMRTTQLKKRLSGPGMQYRVLVSRPHLHSEM